MEIIILFVVISVISSIIKSVGRSQTVQKAKEEEILPVGAHVEKPKKTEHDHLAKQYNSMPKDDKRVHFKKESSSTISPRIAKTAESGLKVRSISRSRLVEGIILSEILGPPKSRRPSFKN